MFAYRKDVTGCAYVLMKGCVLNIVAAEHGAAMLMATVTNLYLLPHSPSSLCAIRNHSRLGQIIFGRADWITVSL